MCVIQTKKIKVLALTKQNNVPLRELNNLLTCSSQQNNFLFNPEEMPLPEESDENVINYVCLLYTSPSPRD